MKLSANLTLEEATKSNTAIRKGIDNTPTSKHLTNLKITAYRLFQPIRRHFGEPIYISSGYRSKRLNEAIGGSETSDHTEGKALDVDQDHRNTKVQNIDIFNFVKDNLDFDQLILEYPDENGNPKWVHMSYTQNNRKEVWRSDRVGDKTVYTRL